MIHKTIAEPHNIVTQQDIVIDNIKENIVLEKNIFIDMHGKSQMGVTIHLAI
jgi:hypothetical protein